MRRPRLGWPAALPAALASLLLAATAHADEYYVAPDGDDAGPGTLERPFASVEQALVGGFFLGPSWRL